MRAYLFLAEEKSPESKPQWQEENINHKNL